MRTNPHILEINTRSWLKRQETQTGRKFTLDDIPDSSLQKMKEDGFDAVWFMGVWTSSPTAQKIARANADIQNQIRAIKPDFKTEDITASPYAVYDYEVDPSLGGNDAIRRLHER